MSLTKLIFLHKTCFVFIYQFIVCDPIGMQVHEDRDFICLVHYCTCSDWNRAQHTVDAVNESEWNTVCVGRDCER